MKTVFPEKLKPGDQITVIAPSHSGKIISKQNMNFAEERFNQLGLKVVYSKKLMECDSFNSSSIENRVNDLHRAFLDEKTKAIFTVIGGFNANHILKYIDYKLIAKHPKIICGFSDITVLSNAIYAKTGMVTYSGPNFSILGMLKGNNYTVDYLKKCFFSNQSFEIISAKQWSDDEWFLDQKNRVFIKNKGWWVINKGKNKKVTGKILGGNLNTFNLLSGTEYYPNLANSLLFIEDDFETRADLFDRDLQSLIQQPNFNQVKALIIGRFQKQSKLNENTLTKIIKTKKELANIPVVANVDFGHTAPIITFPIGGKGNIVTSNNKVKIIINKH